MAFILLAVCVSEEVDSSLAVGGAVRRFSERCKSLTRAGTNTGIVGITRGPSLMHRVASVQNTVLLSASFAASVFNPPSPSGLSMRVSGLSIGTNLPGWFSANAVAIKLRLLYVRLEDYC